MKRRGWGGGGGGGITASSTLTSGRIPVATSGSALADGWLEDDGTGNVGSKAAAAGAAGNVLTLYTSGGGAATSTNGWGSGELQIVVGDGSAGNGTDKNGGAAATLGITGGTGGDATGTGTGGVGSPVTIAAGVGGAAAGVGGTSGAGGSMNYIAAAPGAANGGTAGAYGSHNFTGNVNITGQNDAVQLSVKANATQTYTNAVIRALNSDATKLFQTGGLNGAATYGTIWLGDVTPNAGNDNFTLTSNGTATIVNAPSGGSCSLGVGNANHFKVTSAGFLQMNSQCAWYSPSSNIVNLYASDLISAADYQPLASILTAGTLTQTNKALSRKVIHRYDWTNAMVVALGAGLTGDVPVCTLPAKTVVTNAYVVITGQGAGTTTLTVALGRTGAGYIDYIVASDAKVAANTVYGDASAERGTNLTGYDLPSYTGTTAVKLHFISTVENLDQVTGSTGAVYIETMTLP